MGYIKIVRSVKPGAAGTFDPTARPTNDAERVEALRKLKILDTPSEEIFSLYSELAALTFSTPIALISFVDEERVFYKESFGVNRTGEVVNRKNSPCSLAILNDEVTLLRYALSDPCVLADSQNLEQAGYKFYAGAPIRTENNFNIGMLAVVDKKPRNYTDAQLDVLKSLAAEIMQEIKLRLENKEISNIRRLNDRLLLLRKRVDQLRP
jgi:GAF domain-containing protein